MDEACFHPWVSLKNELSKLEKSFEIPLNSFTIELGSEEVVSSQEAQTDALRLLHFLKAKNFHNNELTEVSDDQYHCLLKDFKSYFAPRGGLCEYLVAPGLHFKKDDELALIHHFDKTLNSWEQTTVKAQADGIMINQWATSNVGEGQNLFQVMESYSKI